MRDFAISPMSAGAQRLLAESGLALALGAALAVMGPFKTYGSDFLTRVGYWVALSAAWFLIAHVVDLLIDRSPYRQRLSEMARLVVKVVLTALPMLLVVVPANEAMFSDCPHDACQAASLYPKVLLVGFGLTLISTALLSRDAPLGRSEGHAGGAAFGDNSAFEPASSAGALATAVSRPGPDTCPLLAKLPPEVRSPILCLEMEDHYVRVHAERGSALLLMRLVDAIEAMGATPGLRVHRSWWVAEAAVGQVARNGRSYQLLLRNDLTVPVSQPYVKSVLEIFDLTV